MTIIKRKSYIKKLVSLVGTPDIKVITGIRRCGKSELLKAFAKKLQKEKDNNVINIDFSNTDFERLTDSQRLCSYVEKKCEKKKNNFLLIDEIQECTNFAKALNDIYVLGKCEIYITSSNSFLLSSELATFFAGRYVEIPVFPFSLQEFALCFSEEKDIDSLFEKYVAFGGFAESYDSSDDKKRGYIRKLYKTIIEQDIVQRHKLKDETNIKCLCEYLMTNIGAFLTSNKIANSVSGKISHVTTRVYLEYLCRNLIFHRCGRLDLHMNTYLNTNQKFYIADHSFRNAILGKRSIDWALFYENIVYIELLRRGYEVCAGKLYKDDIDFVAKKDGERMFIQVSDDVSREETLVRNTESLLKIRSADPKIIIARTKHPTYVADGIKIYDIARWLKEA